jgi:ABC-type transport system involved in cytochrome c biogenesis permease subunit
MRIILFLTAFLLVTINNCSAQDLRQFKRILIADQGRIKPLDSFSKTLSLKISGQSKNHNEWLYEALLEPEKANEKDFFLIENPELKEALNLDKKKKRFSFNELDKASKKLFELARQIAPKEEKDLTLFDKQVIVLRTNFYAFINITNAFLYSIENKAFTTDSSVASKLNLGSSQNSLYDILQVSEELSTEIAKIDTNKDELSALEQGLLKLSMSVYAWVENFKNFDDTFVSETRFSIIPISKNEWLSPWQVIFNPKKETNSYLRLLSEAQKNYKDPKIFNEKLKDFNKKTLKAIDYKSFFVEAEILYNKLNPFKFALIFYLIAIISIGVTIKIKSQIALTGTVIAFAFNTIGLILRIIIMQRAPVSNIYETFIFIAWAIALIGLIIYLIEKNNIGILLSSICGFALLLISFKFAAEGDTMQALIAVLNSNFWLSTHVITITLGYAGVFAAGVIGHVYIIQKLIRTEEKVLSKTKSYLLGILGFGLAMSFLGTLLGGIWADQSWGRFWGWDPKENGALLIVLWTALLFHARLSGFIKDVGLAQGAVLGCIIVMLSWLGVNLLGVGLHSYGFTSGLFYALLVYSIIEIVFVITTSFLCKSHKA